MTILKIIERYTWKRWNYGSWTLSQWAHQQGYIHYNTTYIQILRIAEQYYILHIQTHTWKHAGQGGFQKYGKNLYWLIRIDAGINLPSGEHMKNIHLAGEKGKRQSSDSSHLLVGRDGWDFGEGTTLSSTVPLKENSSKQHKMSRSHQRWLVSTRTSIVWFPVFFCLLQRCHSFKNCTFLSRSR